MLAVFPLCTIPHQPLSVLSRHGGRCSDQDVQRVLLDVFDDLWVRDADVLLNFVVHPVVAKRLNPEIIHPAMIIMGKGRVSEGNENARQILLRLKQQQVARLALVAQEEPEPIDFVLLVEVRMF